MSDQEKEHEHVAIDWNSFGDPVVVDLQPICIPQLTHQVLMKNTWWDDDEIASQDGTEAGKS